METPRILVVDDESGIREGLRALLEREGYSVQTAATPWDAVRLMKRSPFQCLLIDLDLTPDAEIGVNGLDVIALLRIHRPDAKAILITASTDPGLTRLACDRGAVARLDKPVDVAALKALLRNLFPTGGPAQPPPHLLCPSG